MIGDVVTGNRFLLPLRFFYPDNSFDTDGVVTTSLGSRYLSVDAMALQEDRKILLGGYAHSNIPGGADMTLVRLNENGIPDFTFDDDGIAIYEDDLATSSEIQEMILRPDGKIVGTGLVRVDGINSIRVARFISGLFK